GVAHARAGGAGATRPADPAHRRAGHAGPARRVPRPGPDSRAALAARRRYIVRGAVMAKPASKKDLDRGESAEEGDSGESPEGEGLVEVIAEPEVLPRPPRDD